MDLTQASKFLSFILRHKPEAIAVALDQHGWANIDVLIANSNSPMFKKSVPLTRELIEQIVKEDEKQRYSISEDGHFIRANQGHSVKVDVEMEEKIPPITLYHGTVDRFLSSIRKEGLKPMKRLHVHLSADVATAENVSNRRGSGHAGNEPVTLTIDTRDLVKKGQKFYLSANGVWLTSHIPPESIV